MPTRRTFIAGATALALAPLPALADAAADARQTVSALLVTAHDALRRDDKPTLYRAIGEAFDFDTWERFLLGDRKETFAPNQLFAFRALLPGYLAYLYREQFDRGLDRAPALGEVRAARRDLLVSSVFPRADRRDLPVDWRVRQTEAGQRIIDVMIGGTSFLLLKRDEFAAIMADGGPDAVLGFMRENSG